MDNHFINPPQQLTFVEGMTRLEADFKDIVSVMQKLTFLPRSDLNSEAITKINAQIREFISSMHAIQFSSQWGTTSPPEWFDHYLDLYYQWGKPFGNVYWVERGIFSLLAIEFGANVLELCCGDGFNAKYFYSYKARNICACDFDPNAIRHAQTYNMTDKTNFILADIRTDMPTGRFDNIIWDAAIEHFTESEIIILMTNIKNRLTQNGILSGYTIVEKTTGKSHKLHEYEFKSKEDLMRFLAPYFVNVKIFETIYPDRHNLYFYASDATLPLDDNWRYSISK